MPTIRTQNLDRRNPASCYLGEFERSVYSQNGEDGILEKIFEIIGVETSWCVEFGAWDGVYLSNTCHLIRDLGWSAVLIEGNPHRFADLVRNHEGNEKVTALQEIVGFDRGTNSIDDFLRKTPLPRSLDLISIDIDGADYYIWQSMHRYRARVVVIEYNPTVPNDVVFIQDRDMEIHQGCSLAALIELGKRKRYELVAVTKSNGVFVIEELFPAFNIPDNSIDAMRANVIGRIFHCFDGTIYNQMLPLYWTGNPTRPAADQFQVLSPEQRVFGDAVESARERERDVPASENRADNPPLLVMFAGQSNMVGHAEAADGEKPVNPRVLAWNNNGSDGMWFVAELGRAPFNGSPEKPNSAALHFADMLQRRTGRDVYLVGWPVSGSTLLSWAGEEAPNMDRMIAELEWALASDALRREGVEAVDTLLWHQGESDDTLATMVHEPKLTTLSSYSDGFVAMLKRLAGKSWWMPGTTKVIAGELADNGWLSARNDFYKTASRWPEDERMTVVSSKGLSTLGDRAHFTGVALSELGQRMFRAWQTLEGRSGETDARRTAAQRGRR